MSAQGSPLPQPTPGKNNNKLLGAETLIGETAGDGTSELVGGTDVAQSSPPPHPTPGKINNKLLGADTLIGETSDDGTSKLVGGTDVTPKSTTRQKASAKTNSENSCAGLTAPVANSQLFDDKLPDLVLNQQTEENIATAVTDPPTLNTTQTDAATTEDEEDAAEALLRLGDDMNLGPIDDNSTLMPIGGTGDGVAIDAVPVPIKLSKGDVQEATRGLETNVTMDANNNTVNEENAVSPVRPQINNQEVPSIDKTPVNSPPTSPPKGKLEVKEYGIKKKTENEKLKFKCVQCPMRFKTRKECNKHYVDTHQPLLCDKCNKVFKTPASLSLRQYDHEELRFTCKRCGKGFHFKGQLAQHKVDHRTTRTFQCMHSGCGRWFKRKGDLVLHLETHKNKEWKCKECNHTTTCEKYLKDHVKSQHETDKADYKYKCAICNKSFLYRTQLARHKDSHLK